MLQGVSLLSSTKRRVTRLGCLVLLCTVFSAHEGAAQTRAAQGQRSAGGNGTMRVFIPFGFIKDKCWIYVNGHLVTTAQRHEVSSDEKPGTVTYERSQDGWEIWSADGVLLRLSNEKYFGLYSFVDKYPKLAKELFQSVDIKLRPGTYSVQLLIHSDSPDSSATYASFPFAVTTPIEEDVEAGKTANVYIGLPPKYYPPIPVAARGANPVCPWAYYVNEKPELPNLNDLRRVITEYNSDPMVRLMRGAFVSRTGSSPGLVILDLPPTQGGSREFDGEQIREIAYRIRGRHSLPQHKDVVECMEKAPQFSRSYEQYDLFMKEVNSEIESFMDFGAELERRRRQ